MSLSFNDVFTNKGPWPLEATASSIKEWPLIKFKFDSDKVVESSRQDPGRG